MKTKMINFLAGFGDDEEVRIETNREADFRWDDEENDLEYETININEVVLPVNEIKKLLLDGEGIETTNWKGTVVKEKKFSEDKVKVCSKPAFGGFGNTNGIPELGALFVSEELLLSGRIN